MPDWKNTSHYALGDKDRTPNEFTFNPARGHRLVIWYDRKLNQWKVSFYLCGAALISDAPTGKYEHTLAQDFAIVLARTLLQHALNDLGPVTAEQRAMIAEHGSM